MFLSIINVEKKVDAFSCTFIFIYLFTDTIYIISPYDLGDKFDFLEFEGFAFPDAGLFGYKQAQWTVCSTK